MRFINNFYLLIRIIRRNTLFLFLVLHFNSERWNYFPGHTGQVVVSSVHSVGVSVVVTVVLVVEGVVLVVVLVVEGVVLVVEVDWVVVTAAAAQLSYAALTSFNFCSYAAKVEATHSLTLWRVSLAHWALDSKRNCPVVVILWVDTCNSVVHCGENIANDFKFLNHVLRIFNPNFTV